MPADTVGARLIQGLAQRDCVTACPADDAPMAARGQGQILGGRNWEVGLSDEVRNVFMSHIHEDDDALPQLKGLVSKSGLVVRDGSINADKPNRATSDDYIKSGILAPGSSGPRFS